MSTKAEKHQRTNEQTPSADEQIARLVDLISTRFNGDIAGYFESVARPKAEDEAELDENENVQLFLRSYR